LGVDNPRFPTRVEGEKRFLSANQEPIGCNAERRMMMKSAPASTFMSKNFRLRENRRMQFRVDMFNAPAVWAVCVDPV
jgi:hypothetical protein